ncbi:fatty acid synthase, partial [Nephila pilipes]
MKVSHRGKKLNAGKKIVPTKFFVNILNSCGRFEITEGKSLVASGQVYESQKIVFQERPPEYTRDNLFLTGKDIYEELKISGYEFGSSFQGVIEADIEGVSGVIRWQDKWIPFLDSVLLFFLLSSSSEQFRVPTEILSLKIDPNIFESFVNRNYVSEKDELRDTIQKKCAIGFEFSGREEMSGKRLCGFASSQAIATSIHVEPKFCIEIPDNWSLEEAATIPIVYTTCYYCFFTRARLQPRESVLIHSGTGGVGLAAINIALRLNCEIFVTV